MKRVTAVISGLILAFFLCLLVVVMAIGAFLMRDKVKVPTFGKAIAILEIKGPIYDVEQQMKLLEDYVKDVNICGIILDIDSPGGTVVPPQVLYAALKKASKSGKIIVASFGDVAASGAYYIACAADKIVSNPGTVTGSIGVIMNTTNWQDLMNKIGVKFDNVKSGKFKDIGSPNREMTPEEKELIGSVINDVYDQFYNAVEESRLKRINEILAKNPEYIREVLTNSDKLNVNLEQLDAISFLKKITDGRIFTGRQAYKAGLVDEIGTLDDAVNITKKMCNIKGEPRIIRYKRKPTLMEVINGDAETMLGVLKRNGFLLEYRFTP